MKFGISTNLENLEVIEQAHADYIESPVWRLAEYSEDEFASLKIRLDASPVSCEAFNCLLPGGMYCVGDQYREKEFVEYLQNAFSRVQKLGGKIVVFGSGNGRTFPAETGFYEGVRQLIRAVKIVGTVAGWYGLTIALEPLNRQECNQLCTMGEAGIVAAAVNLSNVKLLSDYYHVMKEQDPISDLLRIASFAHIHIATKDDRAYPLECGNDSFEEYFRCLHQIGYNGGITVEGQTDQLAEDSVKALSYLRELEEKTRL